MSPKAKAAARVPRRSMESEEIYRRIQLAIMERRLVPGAKLVEERLAEVTGASRTRIRQVFGRLAHEQVVTLIPNRGAFISRPTVEEARELFLARRLIEPGLAGLLAQQATAAQIQILRSHVDQEKKARKDNDLRSIIRLSGEFHIHIADMVASGILSRVMRELASLTCLIITLYDKPNAPACPHHEHGDLVSLIEAGDSKAAEKYMLEHLQHIEQALDLSGEEADTPDFEAIFGQDAE
jgi:DNA-binding GntR family transcriptional regulator